MYGSNADAHRNLLFQSRFQCANIFLRIFHYVCVLCVSMCVCIWMVFGSRIDSKNASKVCAVCITIECDGAGHVERGEHMFGWRNFACAQHSNILFGRKTKETAAFNGFSVEKPYKHCIYARCTNVISNTCAQRHRCGKRHNQNWPYIDWKRTANRNSQKKKAGSSFVLVLLNVVYIHICESHQMCSSMFDVWTLMPTPACASASTLPNSEQQFKFSTRRHQHEREQIKIISSLVVLFNFVLFIHNTFFSTSVCGCAGGDGASVCVCVSMWVLYNIVLPTHRAHSMNATMQRCARAHFNFLSTATANYHTFKVLRSCTYSVVINCSPVFAGGYPTEWIEPNDS